MKRRFTGKTHIFLAISGALVAVALILQVLGLGINLGIDFTGGSLLTYSVGESYDVEDVYAILGAAGYANYQVTKTEPNEASLKKRAELAEEAPASDETAGGGILNADKSGIAEDKLTDLQIRLTLADETAGLQGNLKDAVAQLFPDAKETQYGSITSRMLNEMDYESVYSGGYFAEFDLGAEFDSAAAAERVTAALKDAGYSVKAVRAIRFDPALELEAAKEPEVTDEIGGETAAPDTVEAAEVEETGTSLRLLVSIETQTTKVRDMIEREMRAKYPGFIYVQIDHVSATAGRGLIANAVKALLIAFACMLVYIAIRFDFYSGVATLGALIHDVMIMYAFMVFFRSVFQANSPFIAAILTIVGYSINNTIIIFDRVREVGKRPGFTKAPKMEVVETSVALTLSRTVNTTITTLISLVFLYIFGVDAIREFVFPLIVGLLAGVYSSVLLATQVWAMWMDKIAANKAAKDGKKPVKA